MGSRRLYPACLKHPGNGGVSVSKRVRNIVCGSSAGHVMDIRPIKLSREEFEFFPFATEADLADLHQLGGTWDGDEICKFIEKIKLRRARELFIGICPMCLEDALSINVQKLAKEFNQRHAIVPPPETSTATMLEISEIAGQVDFSAALKRNDLANPALDILALAIREGDIDRFLRRDGNLNKYNSPTWIIWALQFLPNYQKTTSQCHESYGFDEAQAMLSHLNESEEIIWVAIQTSTHLLILLIAASSYDIVGCMAVKSVVKERPIFLTRKDLLSDEQFWPSFYLVQATTVASHNQPDHLYLIKAEGVGIIGYSKKFDLCTTDIAEATTAEAAQHVQWFGFDHRWRWFAATLKEIREAKLDKYLVGSKKHISMDAPIEPVMQDGETQKTD